MKYIPTYYSIMAKKFVLKQPSYNFSQPSSSGRPRDLFQELCAQVNTIITYQQDRLYPFLYILVWFNHINYTKKKKLTPTR